MQTGQAIGVVMKRTKKELKQGVAKVEERKQAATMLKSFLGPEF